MTTLRQIPAAIIAAFVILAGCSSSPDRDLLRWNSMEGPQGRDVSAILVDRQTPETVYAGLRSGAVYRSTDGGTSWSLQATISPEATVHRFVQHPDDPHRLFACTEQGLFASVDDGATWSLLRVTPAARQPACRAFAFDPYNVETLYAGIQEQGIARSTDGGATWHAANGGNQAISAGTPADILIDPSRPDNILAALSRVGIIHSGNGGNSWQRLTPEFSATGSSPTSLVTHRANPALVVYATDAGSIYRSTDGGRSWRNVRSGSAGGRVAQIVPSSSNPERLYAGSESGVLLSTDFGATWAPLSFHVPAIPAGIAVGSSTTAEVLFLFSDGIGVRRSLDNGATWAAADQGLGSSTVARLATDASGRRVFAVIGQTVVAFFPSNGWSIAGPGLRGASVTSVSVDDSRTATLFATTPLGIFISSDDGVTWQDAGRSPAMSPSFVDVHPTIPTRVFASGERGLFVSTDNGTSWRECTPHGNRYQVTSLMFRPTNAADVHGATAASGILLSSDGGLAWRASSQGLPPVPFAAVTLDPDNLSIFYAWTATGEGFRSVNGGIGWSHVETPWAAGDSVTLAFDKYTPWSMAVVAGGKRLYYSHNGGRTWIAANLAPLPAPLLSLTWNAARRTLYGGTRHEGAFQLSLEEWLRKRLGE